MWRVGVLFLASMSAPGADPRLRCWIRSGGTSSAVGGFAPEVQNVRSDDDVVYVESIGLSLHSLGVLEARPYDGGQKMGRFVYRIPRSPKPAASPVSVPAGVIGTFVNGVPIYNPTSVRSYRDQNLWHLDAVADLDDGTVTTTGRAAPGKEAVPVPKLLQALLTPKEAHSPLIGFALDGYPIYGPYGWDAQNNVRRFRSSYRLRHISNRRKLAGGIELTPAQEGPKPDDRFPPGTFVEDYEYVEGSGDLDRHNGRLVRTPEFPEGTYAYFMATGDDRKLEFPYLIGPTYRGEYLAMDVSKLHVYGEQPKLKLLTASPVVRAAEPASFTLVSSFPVLERVHERQMHLMIISDDLADFDHTHPDPVTNNVFRFTHQFAHGGTYWLFADYTPPGGAQTIARFPVMVEGPRGAPIESRTDESLSALRSGVRASLTTDQPLLTGRDVKFKFSLTDADSGEPIVNLDPYLGDWAHIMLVSRDARDFIHAHPLEKNTDPSDPWQHTHVDPRPSPSEIETISGFHNPGTYKLWLQVQRNFEVLTFPFVLRVQPGARSNRRAIVGNAIPVKVSGEGYEPSRIDIPANRPIRLAFTRLDAQNCASRVVFTELGIERELPPNKTVVIEIPAQGASELHFACGMGMYRGTLLVR
jgi:hypothetical protein